MLSDAFIDWWFAPWRYAITPSLSAVNEDLVSQRDGYRNWCAQAAVPSELPPQFDPHWSSAAVSNADLLTQSASLFMGLIAARQPLKAQQQTLNLLAFDDRKWCLSLAATQLLPAYAVDHPDSDEDCAIRGMSELAIRLNSGFPGLWSRLQMMLLEADRAAVQLRVQNNWADHDVIARSATRSQRCWRLCLQRCRGVS